MRTIHSLTERHRIERVGWLRAAVLGANDGIVSTASLVVGVAMAQSTSNQILISGAAGLVAGAMSMAAGEYVSVSSQADTERADLERERAELKNNLEDEQNELANIYASRGLDAELARQVAQKLMKHDALGAHARDELGIFSSFRARPIQAAFSSAGAFSIGAALPLSLVILVPQQLLLILVSATSLFFLAILGAIAAKAGGAGPLKGALRVSFWGAIAMALTAGIGAWVGTLI